MGYTPELKELIKRVETTRPGRVEMARRNEHYPTLSLEEREKKWAIFTSDPEWLKVREETHKNGPIVLKSTNTIMRPTSYSPMQ